MSHALKCGVALALVYWAWGSSYLAILIGVRDAPPMSFAATRLLMAFLPLLVLARVIGGDWPRRRADWSVILAAAVLIPAGSGGLVAWALQTIPSGQAAVMISSSALWMAVMGSWGRAGDVLNFRTTFFLIIGLLGVAAVMSVPAEQMSMAQAAQNASGHLALLAASLMLAGGMVLLKRRPPACGPFMSAALQAGLGGCVLAIIAVLSGEWSSHWVQGVEAKWALLYLVIVGSVIGYAALFWLINAVTPALLGTYLYVSPAITILLGAWMLDERLSEMQWSGCVLILIAVVLVQRERSRQTRSHDD